MIIGRLFETAPPARPWDSAPVRDELFSVERLEEHATSLAIAQTTTAKRIRAQPLATRLSENAAILLKCNRAIAKSVQDRHHVTPAAEWLIDNYHLVDMQIREIGVNLPPRYYAQLPKLATGPFTGLPRIFGAMWSFVAHTDSHLDPEALSRYLIRSGILHVQAFVPREWPGYEATITWRSARYRIMVENTVEENSGDSPVIGSTRLDGVVVAAGHPVTLVDDGATHTVEISMA